MSMPGSKTITSIFAAVILLGVGAGSGYWWAHHTAPSVSSMVRPQNTAGDGERKILYWHDQMVPGQRFDKPGKSPFMDMQLVPVYADEAGVEGADVRVSPSVAQNLGIRLGRVQRVVLNDELHAVGSVAFDEHLLALVQPRVDGYITQLGVRAPFERVRRGQALAEILAPQWLEAEREYLALLDATAESARDLREAARERLVVLGVPEATIRNVESTRKVNAATTLVAPIDGVVTELGARQGASFMPGATLFQINGLSTVWVNARIPEARASAVAVGAKVRALATGWPGTTFDGRVIALLPEVDRETRTLTARISLENKEGRLSPGMYVTLDFAGREGEPQLVVPSEAIISTGERNVVIVARDAGGFDVANVLPGAEQGGQTVVLSGLREGQSIVLSGQFLIDSEASLESAVNRLGAAAPPNGSAGSSAPASSERQR
jgi:Cu(I)/Ag(I) efflux system membrane fusion protein